VKQFRYPNESFGLLDAESAAGLIAAASELAIVIGDDGVIHDLVCSDESIEKANPENWIGRPWADTVTKESKAKIESMIAAAVPDGLSKWRQVNHPSGNGTTIAVLYTTIRIAGSGRIMAIGRDLAVMAALQQKLLDAQQSMEREYSRLHHVEGRYRLMFRTAPDAVLVVDASNQRIVEANPAAAQVFGGATSQLDGKSLSHGFEPDSARSMEVALARLQATGRTDDVRVRVLNDRRDFVLSASLFRQDNTPMFLVRLLPLSSDSNITLLPSPKSKMLQLIEQSSDGFVVTDSSGRISIANPAFLDLVQASSEEQVRGEPLDRWLGRSGVDLNVLAGGLRQYGSVRLFATTLRGEHGTAADVEISAVSILNGDQPYFGFTIRDIERRLVGAAKHNKSSGNSAVPRSLEQLAELVGRVSLKELVRESTDVIERMCIEAALELTGDNRASAAELLGVSRQSFYMKLRRYGLGDLTADSDESE
jgi:transcriptional regulator PpsR